MTTLPFDLEKSAFLKAVGSISQLSDISLKYSRRPIALPIQFMLGGIVQDMADPIAPTFELKAFKSFGTDPVAKVTVATKTGAGTTAIYTLLLSLDTEAIRTLLGIDGDGPVVDSLSLMGELRVTDANNVEWVSNTLFVTLENAVVQDDDPDPSGVNSGPPWLFWNFITSTSGGGETDLDGVATLGNITTDTAVSLVNITDSNGDLINAGARTDWQLQARTDANSAGQLVRPVDYDADTNARVWTKIA